MRLDLNTLFPPVPPGTHHERVRRPDAYLLKHPEARGKRKPREDVTTKWAGIYALELRGLTNAEIAQALGMSKGGVTKITMDERYIAYREQHLTAIDSEFIQMKPLAFAALKSGLNSADENTALRASEQWFKGAGFGGFAKDPVPQTRTTAEDVAAALLAGVQVNVQVNVAGERSESHVPSSAQAHARTTIDNED